MGWNAKKISVVAGALALLTEAGLNNGLVLGFFYAAASGVAAPVLVHQVIKAHDAEEARLAADRRDYAASRARSQRSRLPGEEPGDADQTVEQTDVEAADSPDMPRRLGPMLVARRVFLASYEGHPDRVRPILGDLDTFLRDDQKALASFARRAQRDPDWAMAHQGDLAELGAIDTRLGHLRTSISPD